MNRLLLGLLACSIACQAPTAPTAELLACTRSYQDADALISACYAICPKDMEQYAKVTGQTFTRSASCH